VLGRDFYSLIVLVLTFFIALGQKVVCTRLPSFFYPHSVAAPNPARFQGSTVRELFKWNPGGVCVETEFGAFCPHPVRTIWGIFTRKY